jgi:DNA-binding transcriptional regulator LsrR (DeoR family)
MNYRKNKIERLSKVARLYYEDDRTQSEIADLLHVSRPLVSRMLREARELGIVEIRVHQPEYDSGALMNRLCQRYGLQGGELIAEEETNVLIDYNLVKQLLQFVESEHPTTLGIGWGALVGSLAALLERVPPRQTGIQTVCPLVGNSSFPSRQFHTDENVRIIAGGLSAHPKFLYAPAFPVDKAEHNLLCGTSHYRSISSQWDNLDMALVGIHEVSPTADAEHLRQRDAVTVGQMLCYPFDQNGRILRPDSDCTIHIPLEKLSHCRTVIGLCAADVSPRTLAAALRTGILTHVFARESVVDSVLTDEWNYA